MFLTLCITKDSNMLIWFNKPRRCFWRNLDLCFASLMLFYTCLTMGIIYSIIYFRGYMFFFYIPRCQSMRLCELVFFTSRGKWIGTYFFSTFHEFGLRDCAYMIFLSHSTISVHAIMCKWCFFFTFQDANLYDCVYRTVALQFSRICYEL